MSKNNKQENKKRKLPIWALKITLVTFIISILFGLLSQFAISKNAQIITLVIILIILVFINIFFDGIALAVTTCDTKVLNSMASQKIKNAKNAIFLTQNAPKVSSICADVIGDVAGIISGACGAAISIRMYEVLKLNASNIYAVLIAVSIGALISAITVGGKAAMKPVAIKHSLDYVMFVASIFSIFRNEDKIKKKKRKNRDCAKNIGKIEENENFIKE